MKNHRPLLAFAVLLAGLPGPGRSAIAADATTGSLWKEAPKVATPTTERAPSMLAGDADVVPDVPLTYEFPALKKHQGVYDVDFAHLACFDFTPPTDPALQHNGERKRVPWVVQALDGQAVRVKGYMLPVTQTDEGRTTSCVIVRSTMVCCYGKVPAPNEWVIVTVKNPGAVVLENVPLYFYGRLHVGEYYENGTFAALYRLDCDKVTMGD